MSVWACVLNLASLGDTDKPQMFSNFIGWIIIKLWLQFSTDGGGEFDYTQSTMESFPRSHGANAALIFDRLHSLVQTGEVSLRPSKYPAVMSNACAAVGPKMEYFYIWKVLQLW